MERVLRQFGRLVATWKVGGGLGDVQTNKQNYVQTKKMMFCCLSGRLVAAWNVHGELEGSWRFEKVVANWKPGWKAGG